MKRISLERRIEAFARLGQVMLAAAGEKTKLPATDEALARELADTIPRARQANPWFDAENVRRALRALGSVLTEEKLHQWLKRYPELKEYPGGRDVLVIMAGNIPLVGFHDMLSVLITGHRFTGRPSSRDAGLHHLLAGLLTRIEPALVPSIRFVSKRPEQADAVIATGSDNTARYFDYYYRNIPAIIRHNRNSMAILDGTETEEELMGLANDIFWYYGLGCRSISKLFVPEGYDLNPLFPVFSLYENVTRLPAYRHNLNYYRALFTMTGRPFLDAGNLLLIEDIALASPAGVLYYQTYKDKIYVGNYVDLHKDKIQCIVGQPLIRKNPVPFGNSQFPELWDYEDGIDTIHFLMGF